MLFQTSHNLVSISWISNCCLPSSPVTVLSISCRHHWLLLGDLWEHQTWKGTETYQTTLDLICLKWLFFHILQMCWLTLTSSVPLSINWDHSGGCIQIEARLCWQTPWTYLGVYHSEPSGAVLLWGIYFHNVSTSLLYVTSLLVEDLQCWYNVVSVLQKGAA